MTATTDTVTSALGQPAIDIVEKDFAPDDLRLWSVTEILKCLHSPGLEYWHINETAKAAVYRKQAWLGMADEDPEGAVSWLMKARYARAPGVRSATDLGTAVHDACETYALTGQRPDVDAEVAPYLDRFDEFLQEWQPEYQATEVTVYSPTYGYAGRCDAFFTIDGTRFIGDYKTSREDVTGSGKRRTAYPDNALQLSAYRYAEMAAAWRPRVTNQKFKKRYYALSPTEQTLAVPVPEVDGGAVVLLTPNRAELIPVRCDENVHEAFLYVLEVARWAFQTSRDVIGEPMEKP